MTAKGGLTIVDSLIFISFLPFPSVALTIIGNSFSFETVRVEVELEVDGIAASVGSDMVASCSGVDSDS